MQLNDARAKFLISLSPYDIFAVLGFFVFSSKGDNMLFHNVMALFVKTCRLIHHSITFACQYLQLICFAYFLTHLQYFYG